MKTPVHVAVWISLSALLVLNPNSPGQGTVAFTPTAFNFQGRVFESGLPANNLYDLQCRLFDAQTGGQQIGATLSLPGVAVTNGYFNVALDFGANVFVGAGRWLETQQRPSGNGNFTTLSDRILVRPTPYATFAYSAANATVASSVSPGGITAAAMSPGAVNSAAIADGTVCTEDLCPDLLNNTFWRLLGNEHTDPTRDFVGTTDNTALVLRVNKIIGYRLEPSSSPYPPSIVGGDAANQVIASGGSTIAGGGNATSPNHIDGGYYSFIGGGEGNFIHDQHNVLVGGRSNAIGRFAVESEQNFIGGGEFNEIDSDLDAVIVGGSSNINRGHAGFIGGGGFNLVASDGGVVVGGANNQAGGWAAVPGGYANHAYGMYSTVAGGNVNEANAFASGIASGQANYIGVTNNFAAILGGNSNTNTAPYASVLNGQGVLADKFGQLAFGTRFAANGDAQASFYHLRGISSPNVQTDLSLDGAGSRLTVARHSAWAFHALVVAKAVGVAAAAGFEIRGLAVNMDGTTTVTANTTALGPPGAFNAAAVADDATDSLVIHVSYNGNTLVRWSAQVETAEVNTP